MQEREKDYRERNRVCVYVYVCVCVCVRERDRQRDRETERDREKKILIGKKEDGPFFKIALTRKCASLIIICFYFSTFLKFIYSVLNELKIVMAGFSKPWSSCPISKHGNRKG